MIKFLIIFFILLLGVHEALLQEDSKIYLWSVVIFTFLSFLIYMLWYFTYYRQYIRNMKRLAEELEYLETHRIIPLLKENSGEILKEKTLEDGRKIFLFNVQDNLFGGLMRYGDGGGIYNRLKEQSSMFNLSIAPRDKEYSSTFVVWDEKNEENSDLKILKEFVSNLCKNLFNTEFSADVFDAVKTLFFHLNICIAGLLGRSGKNKISLLLGDLYDIVREIELATDKTELAIKDDITWFNFRMNLTGHYQSGKPDSSFDEYWSKIRPRNIAGDIIEQLKQIQGAKDVLLVHYPALWSDLAEPVNRYFYEKRNELRLYTADMQLDIKKAVPICQNGRYTIVEGEKLYQERIFDAILCFNLMQHCTKAKSKAYYRKFSGLLCDDGLLMILAAISKDPEVDTFSAERIADRTMMYLDNKISLRNNMFYLATDQGKFPLLLQELDCNDGKKSSLAKKIFYSPRSVNQKNLSCGSLLNISAAGKRSVLCLTREPFMINRGLFSYESEDFETEEQPGQFVPFRKIKVRKEEDLAYLSFDIDPDLSFKMVKLANPSRRPPEELLAAAAKKLAAAFPLILFKENPEIYNNYIDRKFSAVSAEQFLKFSFTLTNVSRGSLKVTFFLHKDMGIDIESFFFLELDGEIFVTYFPEKKLLSEEEFYELSRFGSSYGRISATHQISWKTLNRRLSKISCRPQKAFFYSLGPKALMSPFAREVIKKDDPAENPFKFTAEKFSALKLEKQLELLEELDIHDVLVAARKKKSAGWKAVGSIGKWQ